VPTIRYASDLAEEAVFLFMSRGGEGDPIEARSWHREREPLYLAPNGPEREARFHEHALRWFERLALGAPVERAARSCPRAVGVLASIEVRRVVRSRDEGSEVFGSEDPSAGGARSLVLGVLPCRFLEPQALERIARRELLYVEDMADPAFEFDPRRRHAGAEDPARRELVSDRFRVLWEARIDGKLARPASALPPSTARFRQSFGKSFDPEAVESLFREAWSGELATHAALLERASGISRG